VDITTHCIMTNPKPAKPTDAPIGPMFGFTISASANVNIGGVPMPSLTAKAMGAAFKALFKGIAKGIGKLKGMLGKGKVRNARAALPDVRGPARSNPGRYGKSSAVGKTEFVNLQSYQKANQLIDNLKANDKLKIKGTPEFVAKVEADLRLIGSSNTGRKMLEDITDSGKRVIIMEGGPSSKPLSESDAAFDLANPGGSRPGPGSDSLVKYNPDEWMGPQSPPDTVLAHEMGHARNAAKGEDLADVGFPSKSDELRWTDGEEMQTIKDVENPYRNERGLPNRTGHDDSP
jgi:hypothetical protein